jgi:AsmA protein
VEALLPALGVTLPAGSGLKGGTLSASLGISGTTDKLVIAGPVKLENSKLEGFDLNSKLPAFSQKAGASKDTTIQNASANTRLAPDGARLDSINVTVPSLGTLTGSGSGSPAGALNFNMVADLAGGEEQRKGQAAARKEAGSRLRSREPRQTPSSSPM